MFFPVHILRKRHLMQKIIEVQFFITSERAGDAELIGSVTENHGWILHVIENNWQEIFNANQLKVLRDNSKDEETVHILTTIVEQKKGSLEEGKMVQVQIAPFQFLIIKDASKILVAMSVTNETSSFFRKEADIADTKTPFIARSIKMAEVMEIVKKVSYVDSTVLLLGQSGVGKSMIAKLIHKYSSRSGKSFVSVNCGAIPESLMEAELFGYTNGSFTGGLKGGKKGIFEAANEGTVFLDEVGEMPMNLQVKLLEVLQENCIRPLGATKSVPLNVRVIAATNQNLLGLVQEKRFREDLYYRLHVVPFEIPPLKERIEDIEYLARHFLNRKINQYGVFKRFHPEVEEVFKKYHWPGNVRELENIIERLFIITDDHEIQLKHLPAFFHSLHKQAVSEEVESPMMPLKQAKKMLEKKLIVTAYNLYKSTYKVAEVLQVDQSTVARKLKEFRDESR
ncbi:MAG: hypothetical protein K0R47_4910 [Brevibacillus sp.]|nr:hypothetical protein [Brevibacillus sp.]